MMNTLEKENYKHFQRNIFSESRCITWTIAKDCAEDIKAQTPIWPTKYRHQQCMNYKLLICFLSESGNNL